MSRVMDDREMYNALTDEQQQLIIRIMKGFIYENKRSVESNEIHQDSLREGDNKDAASEEYSGS